MKKEVREFWAMVGVTLPECLPPWPFAMFVFKWESWEAFAAAVEPYFRG